MTKLSAEGAKAVYNEFSKEEGCPDKEWSNWRVFMIMILAWELQTKSSKPKREFLLKLKPIAQRLTNKSDADKLQELVSSYIGQCMMSLYNYCYCGAGSILSHAKLLIWNLLFTIHI